jgi:hypothetical protein
MFDRMIFDSFQTLVIVFWSTLACIVVGGLVWMHYVKKAI